MNTGGKVARRMGRNRENWRLRRHCLALASRARKDSASFAGDIFNYSHRVFTETEKSVSARGLRFCLPPKDVDRFDVKCSFELLYRDLVKLELPLTNENQDRLRSQLKNISLAKVIHMTFRSRRTFSAKMNGKPYPIYAVMTASSLRNQTKEMALS